MFKNNNKRVRWGKNSIFKYFFLILHRIYFYSGFIIYMQSIYLYDSFPYTRKNLIKKWLVT